MCLCTCLVVFARSCYIGKPTLSVLKMFRVLLVRSLKTWLITVQ